MSNGTLSGWSRRPALERGGLTLLACLALLTVAAWAVTVYQAQTMNMPMGVVLRAAADPSRQMPVDDPPGQTTDDPMAGMALDDPTTGMDMSGTNMPTTTAPASKPETSAPDGVASTSATGMAGMQLGGWTWDGFATFLLAWTAMMAAMMFPAAAPMLLLFQATTARESPAGHSLPPTWVFAAGYLLVWTAAGIGTWLLVRLLSDVGSRLTTAERATWAPLALGATLVIAGVYQFTPLKHLCLRQCQSPLGFLMTRWRNGSFGALRMGIDHGAYCLGCCWALFAVLVAAGVMSLAWMLLLTLVVFAEKVLPLGPRAPQAVGIAILLLGILIGVGTADMPWSA